MTRIEIEFRPISEIPDDVVEAIIRGGEMDSGYKLRPYSMVEAWRDDDGRWWVGRGKEIEIIGPTEWAEIADPT